jgi:DNA-directed RNA polymerase subunit RPC12/RpoP
MQFIPCILCGNKLHKRVDKHNKPYFVCDPCGIQFFVRRKQGIQRLDNLLRASERHAIPFQQAAERIFEVQALLSEIDGTKQQINKT